jgi:hypothetical protein
MPNLYFPLFYHYLLQNYSHNIIEITDKYKYLGIVFKNTGLLKYASENLADKARKAFYSLKSKISQSDKFSVKTWIKLYNSVILPIITYGSEIWLTDFNLNLDTLDKLPFEKVQNMIFKNILGVHGKASNLAINAELGTFPACFKSFILMFKYYNRLKRIEFDNGSRNSLLRSAFIEDKKLNKSLNKTKLY